MRTKTPPVVWTDEDGREHRRMTVQRCCNGCRREIGDVTLDEIDCAIAGLPLPDVRDECPWCAPFLEDNNPPAALDKLAIQFACEGTAMHLNRAERLTVVHRLNGRVSRPEIARRCHVSDRQIVRDLHELGAEQCPDCRQLVFNTDGILQRHIRWNDPVLGLCRMSGRRRRDDAGLLEVAV